MNYALFPYSSDHAHCSVNLANCLLSDVTFFVFIYVDLNHKTVCMVCSQRCLKVAFFITTSWSRFFRFNWKIEFKVNHKIEIFSILYVVSMLLFFRTSIPSTLVVRGFNTNNFLSLNTLTSLFVYIRDFEMCVISICTQFCEYIL